MIERIEKLMNSSCKEDILIAMHLVKHNTGIKSPVVIVWWIQRRCIYPYYINFYLDWIRFYTSDFETQIDIHHSELD